LTREKGEEGRRGKREKGEVGRREGGAETVGGGCKKVEGLI
jgi:hypothetical protein